MRTQRGITLIELMVVLGIVGLLMIVMVTGLNRFGKKDLREDTLVVGSSLRAAFNMATFSGTQHRVVFNLENQTFRIEACPNSPKLYRTEVEEIIPESSKREALEALAERVKQRTQEQAATSSLLPQAEELLSPEEVLERAAAVEGIDIATMSCAPPVEPLTGDADGRGKIRRIENAGVKIKRIYVPHLEDPIDEGSVSISFFPLGFSQKAVIELGDSRDNTYFLLVHRLTGLVEMKSGDFDPDDHMRRDGAGDSEDEEDRGEKRD